MSFNVPFIKPDFPPEDEIIEDYRTILANNWYTNFGPYEQRFRSEVSGFIGKDAHATTVANATLGLMITIKALFRESGKVALMPSFTFAAGAEALLWCGYRPVFIDIDPITWQPDLGQAEEYIANNHDDIAGILLCNIFGVGNTQIGEWEAVATKYNLPLVIDSAAGFGSCYTPDEVLGLRGDCEVFSFHATKPFAIGEGGGITTRDATLIERLDRFQNFGFDSNRHVGDVGLNAKLQEIDCAIGLRQLPRLAQHISERQRALSQYQKHLKVLGFNFQDNAENSSVCFASTVAPTSKQAQTFANALHGAGIQSRAYYNPPLHQHPFLNELSSTIGSLEVTDDVCSRIISLPIHDQMSDELIAHICSFANEL